MFHRLRRNERKRAIDVNCEKAGVECQTRDDIRRKALMNSRFGRVGWRSGTFYYVRFEYQIRLLFGHERDDSQLLGEQQGLNSIALPKILLSFLLNFSSKVTLKKFTKWKFGHILTTR